MNVREYGFPLYNGLESQYEHIVYNYLDETLGKLGYSIKIKKTDFYNVDNALCKTKGVPLSCDAYIFSNRAECEVDKNLICLFELESTGVLSKGIKQTNEYCQILSRKYKSGEYSSDNNGIYSIVYDGVYLIAYYYNFIDDTITNVIGDYDSNCGVEIDEDIKNSFFDIFPVIDNINKGEEVEEAKLIKAIKKDLRASNDLLANKSALMTILAAVYGKTKQDSFVDALNMLRVTSDVEAHEIFNRWILFSVKIDYEKNKDVVDNKLYGQAKKLWILSQAKKMDLYGFIYEELVENQKKQEDGEFYTSRHLIRPIISSVYTKYLKKQWKISSENFVDVIKTKKILDPFCGSGGFLYEILKLFKQEYDLKNTQLNKIAKEAVFGFDKNDIMAAYLNLYLVGDGRTNLYQVQSSINWQNIWKYEVKDDKAILLKKKPEEGRDKYLQRMRKIIEIHKETFTCFLHQLIDIEKIKKEFQINLPSVTSLEEFIEYHTDEQKDDGNYSFWDGLLEEDVFLSDSSVLRFIYKLFVEYSTNKTCVPDYATFKSGLGCVDFMATNVPYGIANDVRFKTESTGTLESLALKECIDLLRPSTYSLKTYDELNDTWEDDVNGEPKSNNDGGIATIIIPNRIFEGSSEKEIRDYLFQYCNVLSVIKLPLYEFSPYATIQTFVITIQKKAPFEFSSVMQSKKCFFYIVDNDGRANSNNRYVTNLINESLTKIVNTDNENIGALHEYLHDDFRISIEKYPEGYLSKMERAWIFGQSKTVSKEWNQQRYSSKWNGTNWSSIDETDKKWAFDNLKIKEYVKEVEKKCKKVSDLAKLANADNPDFSNFDFDTQKDIIKQYFLQCILEQIDVVNISVNSKGKVKIQILPTTGVSHVKAVKEYLLERYEQYVEVNQGETVTIPADVLSDMILSFDNCREKIRDAETIFEFLDEVEDLQIEGENVKFYSSERYEQYVLVPEYYLDKTDDFMSADEIFKNFVRLRKVLKEN